MSTRAPIPTYLHDRLMLVAIANGKTVSPERVPAQIAAIERLKKDGFLDEAGAVSEKGRNAIAVIESLAAAWQKEYGRSTERYPTASSL